MTRVTRCHVSPRVTRHVLQVFKARMFGVDMSQFPTIATLEARLSQLPQFVAAHPDNQPDSPRANKVIY